MKYNGYLGKYRAVIIKVESNSYNTRIKVKCPLVLGESPSNWCTPCLPFIIKEQVCTGIQGSSENHTHIYKPVMQTPKVGEPVWVEFEQGDLSKPIWIGTWR